MRIYKITNCGICTLSKLSCNKNVTSFAAPWLVEWISTVHYVLTSSFLLNLSNFLLTQQQRRFVSHFSVLLANAFNQSQTTNKDFLIFDGESFFLFPFRFVCLLRYNRTKHTIHAHTTQSSAKVLSMLRQWLDLYVVCYLRSEFLIRFR